MKSCFRNHIFVVATLAMIGFLGFNAVSPVHTSAKSVVKKTVNSTDTSKKKEEVASKKGKAPDSTSVNREKFLSICKTMGQNLHNKGFRYGNSSRSGSYSSALKHKRVATCATYVSWCLQEYGVLKKGKLFYSKGRGVPNKKSWDKSKIQVVKVYKKTKKANLQPGDVVCWASGKSHVCIYAGKNSKGKRLWYDAGRHQSTYGHCAGSRYKVVSARHNKYLENRLVGYVIRIK